MLIDKLHALRTWSVLDYGPYTTARYWLVGGKMKNDSFLWKIEKSRQPLCIMVMSPNCSKPTPGKRGVQGNLLNIYNRKGISNPNRVAVQDFNENHHNNHRAILSDQSDGVRNEK